MSAAGILAAAVVVVVVVAIVAAFLLLNDWLGLPTRGYRVPRRRGRRR